MDGAPVDDLLRAGGRPASLLWFLLRTGGAELRPRGATARRRDRTLQREAHHVGERPDELGVDADGGGAVVLERAALPAASAASMSMS